MTREVIFTNRYIASKSEALDQGFSWKYVLSMISPLYLYFVNIS